MGCFFFNKDAVIFISCVDVGNSYKLENAMRCANFIINRKTKWKPKQFDGFVSFKNIDSKHFDWLLPFAFEGYEQDKMISFMIGELKDKTKIDYYKKQGSFYYDVRSNEKRTLNKVLEICYMLADPTMNHNSAHARNLDFNCKY